MSKRFSQGAAVVSGEQQLFSLVEALEEAAIAADSAFTEYGPADGGESQARLSAARLALLEHVRQRDATIAELRKTDSEAATHVESLICMRTHFTGEPPYVGWRGLGLALIEHLDKQDAQLAELRKPVADCSTRGHLWNSQRKCIMCNVDRPPVQPNKMVEIIRSQWATNDLPAVRLMLDAYDALAREVAELRMPVAVEKDERVEQIRLEHLAANSVQEMPSWQYAYETRRDLLSAYDTLAQNHAHNVQALKEQERWANGEIEALKASLREQTDKRIELQRDNARCTNAREVIAAEMRGMRERLETLTDNHTFMHGMMEHYRKREHEEIHAAHVAKQELAAAQERERQLRAASEQLLEFVNRYCEPSSGRDTCMVEMRAALAQPQALKYDAASGAISVDLSAHLRSPEGRAQLKQVAAVREVLAQPRPSEPLDPRPVGGIGIDQGQFVASCAAGNQVFGEGGTFGGGGEHG